MHRSGKFSIFLQNTYVLHCGEGAMKRRRSNGEVNSESLDDKLVQAPLLHVCPLLQQVFPHVVCPLNIGTSEKFSSIPLQVTYVLQCGAGAIKKMMVK